jgi:hypothetical protein
MAQVDFVELNAAPWHTGVHEGNKSFVIIGICLHGAIV